MSMRAPKAGSLDDMLCVLQYVRGTLKSVEALGQYDVSVSLAVVRDAIVRGNKALGRERS